MLTRSVFSSLSTVPYSIKNPITCFQLSTDVSVSYTLTRSLEVTTVSQCVTKWESAALNFFVLNLVYRALTSAWNSYEETTRRKRTEPDLSFLQSVFDTTEPGIVDLRRLQEVDGQGNVCPPVAYISDLIYAHVFKLAEKIITW